MGRGRPRQWRRGRRSSSWCRWGGGRLRGDSQRRQTDQAEQDRRDSLLETDGDAAGAGDRRRLKLRGGGGCLQSRRLCLLGVKWQPALVEGGEGGGLAPGERGRVCLRR